MEKTNMADAPTDTTNAQSQDTSTNQPATPTNFPIDLTLTLTFKVRLDTLDLFKYYTEHNSIQIIGDLYDILDDQMFGTLLTINGLSREDVLKKIQALA
jgi:hypothetical protein